MSPRLALVIGSLDLGGAQRILTILGGHWVQRGWRVELFTFDAPDYPVAYALPPGLGHAPLDLERSATSTWQAVRKVRWQAKGLRAALRDFGPDVIVSFLEHANIITLWATRHMNVPVFVSERVDPTRHPIGRRWSWMRELLYPRAAAIVVQTERVRTALSPRLRARARVVPNPVPTPAPPTPDVQSGAHSDTPRIVAMGRLVPQKGFDLLVEAFARNAERHADWQLVIWGEGPERARLESRIHGLGLTSRILLPGRTEHPADAMRAAQLFVLSSRYEGFPNVLCEAMALGLAVLASDCPSGPAEIVRPGQDGELVEPEDVGALARSLDGLLSDPQRRARLGQAARSVLERFSLDRVGAQWEQLFAHAGVAPPSPRPLSPSHAGPGTRS